MKQVSIGGVRFSKILCGTNQFYGHSHFSEARNAEYLSRFDDETILRTMRRCIDLGVNAIESCANERIMISDFEIFWRDRAITTREFWVSIAPRGKQ